VCVFVCLIMCDLETSTISRPTSELGCSTSGKIKVQVIRYKHALYGRFNGFSKFIVTMHYSGFSCRLWNVKPT